MDLDVPEHIRKMFAVTLEASRGAPANGPQGLKQRKSRDSAKPVITMETQEPKVLVLHPEERERRAQLFASIDRGDGNTIKELIAAKVLKDGTEMQQAISLVPQGKNDLYHFPEPLLQRAVRSGKQESVSALINIASKYPVAEREAFVNATRPDDKATVLHDLAASIPQGQKVEWSPKASSRALNAAQLIDQLVDMGADVMARNRDGNTAADVAHNIDVRQYLDAKIARAIAEDEQSAQRWQKKHAPLAAGHTQRVAQEKLEPDVSVQL